MEIMFAEHELHSACQVLFGSKMQTSRGFLEYLQLSGIKSAYRQKAMETHPDRFLSGALSHNSTDLFLSVQQAYESLCRYVNARKKGCSLITKQSTRGFSRTNSAAHPPFTPKPPTARQTAHSGRSHTQRQRRNKSHRPKPASQWQQTRPKTSTIYTGSIPARKLLFGHYLYYSGIANWQTITKALVWQRTKRPRIGELGCRYGWLSSKDILNILRNRSQSNTFGKSAIDLGLLTKAQLKLLILQQNRLQKKFGDYFVANNLLSPSQINQLVRRFRNHNYSVIAAQTAHRTM